VTDFITETGELNYAADLGKAVISGSIVLREIAGILQMARFCQEGIEAAIDEGRVLTDEDGEPNQGDIIGQADDLFGHFWRNAVEIAKEAAARHGSVFDSQKMGKFCHQALILAQDDPDKLPAFVWDPVLD